jgi:hypothetical protein
LAKHLLDNIVSLSKNKDLNLINKDHKISVINWQADLSANRNPGLKNIWDKVVRLFLGREKGKSTADNFKYINSFKLSRRRGFGGLIKYLPIFPFKNFFYSNLIQFCGIGVVVVAIISLLAAYSNGLYQKNKVQGYLATGYENFKNATLALNNIDLEQAFYFLKQAEDDFAQARADFSFLPEQTRDVLSQNSIIKSGDILFNISEHFSLSGQYLLFFGEGMRMVINNLLANQNQNVIEALTHTFENINLALAEIKISEKMIQDLEMDIFPKLIQEKINKARSNIAQVKEILAGIDSSLPVILKIIGYPLPQRYLFLLQNNNEIRATGGFIGSFMIVQMNDGQIEKVDFRDVYEIDNQLLDLVDVPEGLSLIADHWGMRDANYSPDFPTSVQDILWFLEKGKGPTVNGVVVLDQTIVEELLALTGPISLPQYDLEITADNFSFLTSFFVEAKLIPGNTPKKILMELIPLLGEKIKESLTSQNISLLIKKALNNKHLAFYSTDEYIQQWISILGYSGEMRKTMADQDYFQMVLTSIGGNKSDKYLEYQITQQTLIKEDGSLFNQVEIKAEHVWRLADEQLFNLLLTKFGVRSETAGYLLNILGKGENQSFVRVYVPWGSKIIDFSENINLQTDTDLQKTVFKYITPRLAPFEKTVINFTYQLPFSLPKDQLTFTYYQLVQKQMGMKELQFNKSISLEGDEFRLTQLGEIEERKRGEKEINQKFSLDTDQEIEVIIKRKSSPMGKLQFGGRYWEESI